MKPTTGVASPVVGFVFRRSARCDSCNLVKLSHVMAHSSRCLKQKPGIERVEKETRDGPVATVSRICRCRRVLRMTTMSGSESPRTKGVYPCEELQLPAR